MNLPSQIGNTFNNFLKPKISFSTIHNQYLFDKSWLIDVTKETLREKSLEILNLVNDHLISGLDTKNFLQDFIQMAHKEIDWYKDNSINSIDFIDNIKYKIKNIDYFNLDTPASEFHSINDIIEENEAIIEVILREESYYHDLYLLKNDFNNYKDPLDIERVKLYFILNAHYDFVCLISNYLSSILEDYDRLNFERFDFDKLLMQNGLITPIIVDARKKCAIHLKKIDVANLFYFLTEEKIFVFSKNEQQNKNELQKFIEENFTYRDDDDLQKNISRINKEFSKVGYSNDKSHIAFLDLLIEKINNRKLNIS